jgi:hypothetical protein
VTQPKIFSFDGMQMLAGHSIKCVGRAEKYKLKWWYCSYSL